MNILMKFKFILLICVAGSFFSLANAEQYDQDNLNEIIQATQAAVGLEDLTVDLVVFARGIQSYSLDEDGWKGAGPLAKLYSAEDGVIGDEKIGTHYAHLPTPAWEAPGGRVIAESAEAIPQQEVDGVVIGADEDDVVWLNVKLQPNALGYVRLLRVLTTSGQPPRDIDNYKQGVFIGTGYTTFYVLLK